ncbi:hypothetical protein ACFS07_17065 [Undibacterium arcticum]
MLADVFGGMAASDGGRALGGAATEFGLRAVPASAGVMVAAVSAFLQPKRHTESRQSAIAPRHLFMVFPPIEARIHSICRQQESNRQVMPLCAKPSYSPGNRPALLNYLLSVLLSIAIGGVRIASP